MTLPNNQPRTKTVNNYDVVPYDCGSFPYAQCRRLETIGRMHQMAPAPSEFATVLELGCGNGMNLIGQACDFPSSKFIGCDSSRRAVADGMELIEALGLNNIELRVGNITEIDRSWGKFDYILCHGVFSWVETKIRDKILAIMRDNLNPCGFGQVSYNTLPGWHLRRVVRDLARHHTTGIDDPADQVAQVLEFLSLVAETQTKGTPYAKLIREEYEFLSRAADSYLFHEMLEPNNQAFYLHEFVEQLDANNLAYVGESGFSHLSPGDIPERARTSLWELPVALREQYVDYLRGTTFRTSMICHRDSYVDHHPDPTDLERFRVAFFSDANLEAGLQECYPNDKTAAEVQLSIGQNALRCADPRVKLALRILDQLRPAFVGVRELCARTSEMNGKTPVAGTDSSQSGGNHIDCVDPVLEFLWAAVAAGAIEVLESPPPIVTKINHRPVVSSLSRHQAKTGRRITNQLRESIRLSGVSNFIAGQLDGTHDFDQLKKALRNAIDSRTVLPDPFEKGQSDEDLVRQSLHRIARSALIVA